MAGVAIKWAGNHWPKAVSAHQDNHPEAVHICQDLQQFDFSTLPEHDILLASPCCQGHTKARGREQSYHDASRATAWAVVTALEAKRPPIAVIENVPEFLQWKLFPAWVSALQILGYSLSQTILDAADSGVPQHRIRVFLVATKSKSTISLKIEKKAHQAIAPYIKWERFNWSHVFRPGRSASTIRRVASGRSELGQRFVMPYYTSGSGLNGRSIWRPLGTVTTRARWAVVMHDRMRMLHPVEIKDAMGFLPSYKLPDCSLADQHRLLGNAVCPPQARDLLDAVRRSV